MGGQRSLQFRARGGKRRSAGRPAKEPRSNEKRNTNTGGELATEPGAKGRVAKITITTGPRTRSALELPQPDASVLAPTP